MSVQQSPVTSSAASAASAASAVSTASTAAPPRTPEQENNAAYDDEYGRIKQRRDALGVPVRPGPEGHWGLALSGGGIRSATFSLGVLQGLALAGTQPCKLDAAATAGEKSGDAADRSLLEQFDYLSTVSGGGYIGGFFGSLFVPGRWRPLKNAGQPTEDDAIAAAADAYEALRFDPPGRFRSKENYLSGWTGAGPLAWLRENGRYMMPSGAGDMLYAMALGVRNWLALQYVLGSALLMLFSLLTLARVFLLEWFPPVPHCSGLVDWISNWEACAFPAAGINSTAYLWASPAWLLVIASIYFLVLPVGIMFWLVQPPRGANSSAAPSRLSAAALLALAFAGVLFRFLSGVKADPTRSDWHDVSSVLIGCAIPVLLGGLFSLFISWLWHDSTVSVIRVRATQMQSSTFKITSLVVVIAVLDTLAQQLYWWLSQQSATTPALLPAVLAAFVWLVRAGSSLLDEKEKPGWLRFIPMTALAAAGGVVMLLLVAMVWGVAVQWVRWHGAAPTEIAIHADVVAATGLLLFFSVAQAIVLARFPGFINLSSLQSIYSSRLTRAYLGASNRERFESAQNVGVSDPLPNDALTVGEYYGAALAPVHLINVTVNQTVDPAEQLVQRDRKGKPLVVASASRFAIDGQFYPFAKTPVRGGEIRQPLTLGQWIGVSGAAFTTGLGRTTSLGFSLLLGLANVRLGAWWESGIVPEQSNKFPNLVRALFPTQICLQQELRAKFYGLRRKWQYLSDGGHFENTGAYELLRTERNNRLIVVCDNGCDPDYRFDDLANLIRLARIDLRLELATDTEISKHPVLGNAFGTQEELADKTAANDKCALLLNVFEAGAGRHAHDKPVCCIVVLKPRLIASATLDVHQYWQANPAFPQETTFDQSFDEAQWESYRRLGISTARRVFGCRSEEGVEMASALWSYLFGDQTKELRTISARSAVD